MKKLLSCIAVLFTIFSVVSCLQEERSPEDVLIPSPAQVECSDASLALVSKVPSGAEKLVYECGFLVGTDKSLSGALKAEGVLDANQFKADFPVRDYGTTYYMCAYVTNGHGSEIRSDLRSYDLEPLQNYVVFDHVNLLVHDAAARQTSVTIDADIWDGVVVSEAGVCYGAEPTSLTVEGVHEKGFWQSESGLIAIVLKDITEATQYYLRPYVKDGDYLTYGEVVPFYIPAVAKVATFDAEAVTASGATLLGEVTDECGSAVTECGFAWVEGDAVPTIEDDHIVAGSGIGTMTATVEGLDPNKKYTFRAYATNSSGISYGDPKIFTTLVALPALATSTISNITSTSATFNGVLANDGGESVSEVGFYYSTDKEVNPETAQKVSLEYSTYQKSVKELSVNTLLSAMQSAQKAASDEGEAFSIDVIGLGIKTKYYVKSYAVNSAGVSYGPVVNFKTSGEIATIKTVGSSDVTTSSAVLEANITTDNGEKITERGFVWMEGTDNPTTDSNKLKVDGTTGEYTATLKGLDPNKKYSFRAYAINAEGTAYGDVINFTTKVALPALSGVVISSITSTSATLSGKVADHGGETVTEVGFYYGTDELLSLETATKVSLPYSEDSFSADISELLVNTKYYVRSFAMNSAGTEYSDVESFTTAISSPAVKTVGSSDITATSSILSGIVVSDNGAEITERGFVWLQGTSTPTTDSFKLKVAGTTGDYTSTLEGLNPNQKYSFRAYAINSKGTAYGEIMTFSTIVDLPVLSAVEVSNIKETSAIFSSTVTDHGGATVSEVGFYYSKTESFDVSSAEKVSKAFSTDGFTLSADNLEVGTVYYVRAFAKNSAGEGLNDIVSFKTISAAPVVITMGSSKLTATSAELSGEVMDDNGESITDRGFVWMKGTGTPTTSDNKLQVIGTTGEFSATLEDLEPNRTYSFRVYAVNSEGISYGETSTFETEVALPIVEFTSYSDVTSSSATVSGKVTYHGGETVSEVGFLYGTTSDLDPSAASKVKSTYNDDSFSFTLSGLTRAQDYYVQPFATNSKGTSYGESVKFTTLPDLPTMTTNDVTYITDNSAVSGGTVVDDGGAEILAKGLVWSRLKNPTIELISMTSEGGDMGVFTSSMLNLISGTTYYVRAYATNMAGTSYGEQKEFRTTGEAPYDVVLDAANCFIVSSSDTYSFDTVKGNSSESVGDVVSAEVLWESFGTSETPSVGSLIASVSSESGSIVFEVANPYRGGNAVIAAKDASGTILWSWHIWLTDEPQEQVYNNNAGTMMDRNLGATSATLDELVGSYGLLYQWGRKDPFLGSSSFSSSTEAKSTITWPSAVSSDSSNGTISYATEHPTTFITWNSSNWDWYYTGDSSTDNTRWQSEKTIYDPCPAGYRVPDGGKSGVWATAGFIDDPLTRKYYGRLFNISSPATTWYPHAGKRDGDSGNLISGGSSGYYWSVSHPNNYDYYPAKAYVLYIMESYISSDFGHSNYYHRAYGFSVRCFKEEDPESAPH